jgi:cystathionine gamma-synthase
MLKIIKPLLTRRSAFPKTVLFNIRSLSTTEKKDAPAELPYKLEMETILASGGCETSDPLTGAVVPPLYLSTTFERSKETLQLDRGYNYSRLGNPTRSQLESLMTKLENGKESFAFSSGMQAAMSLLTCLPNSYVLLPDDLYHGISCLLGEIFSKWGIKYEKVDMTDLKLVKDKIESLKSKAEDYSKILIWLETPSNPLCKVSDIKGISVLSQLLPEEKTLLLVDTTWSTPYLTRPLDLGADIVLHSSTKYLNGHCDSMGGILTVGNTVKAQSIVETLRTVHQIGGGVLSPFDSWLTLRGMRTLSLRMKVSCTCTIFHCFFKTILFLYRLIVNQQ